MRSNFILLFCTAGVLVLSSVVLSQDVRGTPGFDYPNYLSIPRTSFKCSEQQFIPGFYADLETQCQAFHFCFKDNQESFLCPTGTTFNQQKLMCDVWFSSNCSLAPIYYSINSGPAMRNAAKKLPMFLKLRSRSQEKLPVQSSTAVYETIASLFENSDGVSVEDNVYGNAEQVKVAENLKTSSQDPVEKIERAGSQSSKVMDGKINLQNEDDESTVEEQDPDNLVYDPARNGYYVNYSKSNAGWSDYDPVEDDIDGFYRYYTNDGYEEMKSDEPYMYASEAEFLKRQLQPGQLAERVRRRPTYVVVPEDGGELKSKPGLSRGIRSPNEQGSATGENTDANTTSENETRNPEPFPRPTAIPHHLLGYSTEEPMTSEEFERAIIEELIAPAQREADARESRASTYPEQANLTTPFPQPAASYEESKDSTGVQGDQFVYVDDQMMDYETEKSMYDWRRPMYVLVKDGEKFIKSSRPRRSPDEQDTSESETPSPEPFPRPTAIPHHLLGYSTEVPMTSEEFESAIIEELIAPAQREADARESRASTYPEHANLTTPLPQPAASYEESQDSTGVQGDQFVYVDQMMDYETEKSMYDWRRPMYVLVKDGEKFIKSSRPRRSPDEQDTSESETPSPEPFPRPTAIPHHLLGYSTEVPMTSEEFESAIIEELIAPAQREADARESRESTYPEHATLTTPFTESADSYEESQAGSTMQSDQFQYVDNMAYRYVMDGSRDVEEFSETQGPQLGYGRWAAQYPHYPLMRPGVPFFRRVPYTIRAPLAADEAGNFIPQINGMLDEHIDQWRNYLGSPEYHPVNYGIYVPESEFGYRNRYSPPPFVPESDDLLYYSLPKYESEYSDIEAESNYGGQQMEDQLLVTSPLPISDLLEPDSQADFEVPNGDVQSEETYYVFDFDEDDQISELDKNGNEVAGTVKSAASAFVLNGTGIEKSQEYNQSLNSLASQNGNAQSDSSQHGTRTANHIKNDGSEKLVPSSSTLERLAAMKTTGSSLAPSESIFDSNENVNKAAFPESMDFGPYGFGASMGQQYGMVDSMHGSKSSDKFSSRKGDDSRSNLSKLSDLQERIRSMKQGKFGVFKKYLSSSKEK